MRWFLPILFTAVGGLIDGWLGALAGFTLGYVIAVAIPKRRTRDVPQGAPPTIQQSKGRVAPPPLPHSERSTSPPAMSQIGVSIAFGREEMLPRRPKMVASRLTWYARGEPCIHARFLIDSGMIYTSERPLPWPGEPSAITISVPVAPASAHPLEELGYYPSYDRISPQQRRCYLEWLAAGRKDEDPAQRSLGYVFMFFYGLERRIVLDRDCDPALLEEIFRLLQHYGSAHKSRSLRSYFLQLLHFAGWQRGAKDYRALWPHLLELDVNRPDEDGLRIVLANLYQRGEPLDWTVAFRLAMANQESRRSTVVISAREKFFALFQQRFNDRFPAGLVLEAAKQEALIQYRAASSALIQTSYERQRDSSFELRIPNVAGLHRQFQVLPQIWNSCVDDLSGYSRVVRSKRPGQSAALAAWKTLPRELRKTEDHPLKAAFDEVLGNAPREGDYVFVSTAALATLAEIPERAKLTSSHSRQIAEIANQLGWHLAPDPRITGLPLAWNQELALYLATAGQEAAEELSGPLRLLYLAVTLAMADGVIEPEELDTFYQLVAPQITRETDWRPIRATEASLRRDANVALRSLPQMSKQIPGESRQFVLRLMAHIAAADGEVSLDELKVLRRIARAFELNTDSVERLLREDEAFREVTIAVRAPKTGRGEAIPARPTEKTAFALDQDRITALTQETQEIISMLSVVMAEPDEAPCVPADSPPVNHAPVTWLEGLATRYHPAVLKLIRRDEITANDFDCIAADHHLMPDDLFNAVNAWADETLGDFLLERAENVRIFRSLLPDVAAISIAA